MTFKHPTDQGKPKGQEPTPIEKVFRAVNAMKADRLAVDPDGAAARVSDLADALRQAAIYDAQREGKVDMHRKAADMLETRRRHVVAALERSFEARAELTDSIARNNRLAVFAVVTALASGFIVGVQL